jgi:hypothetical protein
MDRMGQATQLSLAGLDLDSPEAGEEMKAGKDNGVMERVTQNGRYPLPSSLMPISRARDDSQFHTYRDSSIGSGGLGFRFGAAVGCSRKAPDVTCYYGKCTRRG